MRTDVKDAKAISENDNAMSTTMTITMATTKIMMIITTAVVLTIISTQVTAVRSLWG